MSDHQFEMMLDMIRGAVMGVTGIVGFQVAMTIAWKNWCLRKIEEAKQKSVGAEALNKLSVRVEQMEDSIRDLVQGLFKEMFHGNKRP